MEVTLLENIQKAGVIGLLVAIIVWLVRERARLEQETLDIRKELSDEKEKRLQDLNAQFNEKNTMLEKVIETNNDNLKQISVMIGTHENNVVAILKEQISQISDKIKELKS